MSKQEFIDKLRLALSGRVSAGLVEENVTYYEEYINTQIRLGKTEGAVMATLGDPRLIAKTIISANNGEGVADTVENAKEYSYGESEYRAQPRENNFLKIVRVPGWVWILLVVVVLIIVISVVFSIVTALIPFVLPILVIVFFIKLFRDWLK